MATDIFEQEIILYNRDMDFTKPYPSFNISNSYRFFFKKLDKAISQIKKLSDENSQGKINRFIIRQLPLKAKLYHNDFINLYVFDAMGNFLDQSLCANCSRSSRDNEFKGRPEDKVYFQKGEIVEWISGGQVHLGIIEGLPLSPSQYHEIMERYNNSEEKLRSCLHRHEFC